MATPASTPEVLWSKVDIRNADECWPWKGRPDEGGYARTEVFGKRYLVHRIFYSLANPGKIELRGPKQNDRSANFVLHSCDNPICCNPSHLRLGTHKENIEDRTRRNRDYKWTPGEHPKCKLTLKNAEEIRILRSWGISGRHLAKVYGVSPQTISAVNVGRYYCAGD